MEEIRIGIWDTDEEYAYKLARYLNQKEKGQWSVFVFTKKEYVEGQLKQQRIHLLLGTGEKELIEFQNEYPAVKMICFGDEKKDRNNTICFIQKYRGAELVYKEIKQIVWAQKQRLENERKLYGMYSPIGRCGKTTLILDTLENHSYGKWLYIGMEEYSFLWNSLQDEIYSREDFLYFIKERNEEMVKKMMSIYQDILTITGAPFDKKELDINDFMWLKKMLQYTNYRGAIVDLGTGILRDFEAFRAFDTVLVPYIEDEKAIKKREQFEELIKLCGYEDVTEKMIFLNMDCKEQHKQVMQQLMG